MRLDAFGRCWCADLESDTTADSRHGGSVDIRESQPRRVERLLECRIDDLQVSRHAEPPGDREVVERLEGVLVVET